MEPLPDPASRPSPAIVAGAVGTVAAITLALWYAVHTGALSVGMLSAFMDEHRAAAPVIFVIAHTIAAIAFLPCSPFTALAGMLWDQPYAVLYSMAGALCAACSTFGLARTSAGKMLRDKLSHRPVKWVIAQVEARSWETVAFTQINPVLPASTLGYVFGLSRISFRVYFLTSLAFMLPLQLLFVSVGQTIRTATLAREPGAVALHLAVMLGSGIALFALRPLTRKLLDRDR